MEKSFKAHSWDSPNKMHIDSEYKTFNKQCSLITTGNVFSACQKSAYIRPYSEIKNYGYIGKPGEFLNYDTKHFGYIPEQMKKIVFDKGREYSVILYEFRTWAKDGQKDVFGYVLTDNEHNELASIVMCGYGQNYSKRYSALNECRNYICKGHYKN